MAKDTSISEKIRSFQASDADLQTESLVNTSSNQNQTNGDSDTSKCPFHNASNGKSTAPKCPFHFVPLRMGGSGGTHVPSGKSAALLEEIGGVKGLQLMTEAFYKKAFKDQTLDKFIHSHDDPHGRRFATWIHQKLGGAGQLWDNDRANRSHRPQPVSGGSVIVHDRSSAHVAAWNSTKRPSNEVGRHFQLDECRVWMRLHFWAMRESGLLEVSPSFCDFYVRFIGHFVRVYESKAPPFARESFRWSANPENIKKYHQAGNRMTDVLGISYRTALGQIPEEEAYDRNWPYIQRASNSSEEKKESSDSGSGRFYQKFFSRR